MAQILNPQETIAGNLGKGLGQGIQAGVQGLLEQKLAQMAQDKAYAQRGQAIDALAKGGYLGEQEKLTPDVLSGLKYAPESFLTTLLKGQITAPQRSAESQAATLQAQGIPVADIVKRVPGLSGNFIKELNKAADSANKVNEERRQFGIKQSATYRDDLAKRAAQDEIASAKLKRLKHLVQHQNVASGYGGLLPNVFQGKSTQEANSLIADILLPYEGRANTDAKLRAVVDTFAKLTDTKEAQLEKINRAEELAKLSAIEKREEQKVIKENNGSSPENLQDLVWERTADERNKIFDSILKGTEDWGSGTFDDYPPEKYKGEQLEAENGKFYISDGKEWLPIAGGH